jgi:hypothetical protein
MRSSTLLLRWFLPVAVFAVLATLSLASATSAAKLPPAAGYGSEVTLEPMPGRAGVFVAKAVVKDLATDQVVAAPSLAFPAGEEATAESTSPAGTTLRLRVKADAATGKAEIALSLVAGSEERTLQRTTVQLPRG